jgi:hypothetical protein
MIRRWVSARTTGTGSDSTRILKDAGIIDDAPSLLKHRRREFERVAWTCLVVIQTMETDQGHEMGEAGRSAEGEMKGRKRELLTPVVCLSESSHQPASRAKHGHVNAGFTAALGKGLNGISSSLLSRWIAHRARHTARDYLIAY